ncbi:MAG: hypothetical protein ACRD8O_22500 [Bryobacteraceae bacterium]
MKPPRVEYLERMESRRAALVVREKRRRAFGYLRACVFLAGLAMALAAFGPRAISRWWLLLPLAVFWWLGGRLQTAVTEHATLSRAVAFYERALARLEGRWAGAGETGLGLFTLPDKTMAWMRIHFLSFLIAYSFILWRFHERTSRVIREVGQAASDLGLFAEVLRRLEAERFRSPRLAALRAELDIEGWPPSRRIARLNRLMDMLDSRRHLLIQIIGPLLLWDLHLSYALEDWRRTSGTAMRRWLNAAGEIEALGSLAGYAYDNPGDVFPELVAGSPQFDAEAVGHPLLAEDRVVRNDVSIGGGVRVLMVSGSNMSGKSTCCARWASTP